VIDDGTGGPANGAGNGAGGHGLEGLAERVRPLNGTVEAGAAPEGGYRLAVIVPVAPA
jgi:two-component system, NarL family, sensor histidine kinase DesK